MISNIQQTIFNIATILGNAICLQPLTILQSVSLVPSHFLVWLHVFLFLQLLTASITHTYIWHPHTLIKSIHLEWCTLPFGFCFTAHPSFCDAAAKIQPGCFGFR